MKMRKKWWTIIGILAVGFILAPIIVPIFVPWAPINCRHQDINIKTGQARHSRYLWFVKISERIEPTSLSLVLRDETIDVADIEPWHRVNTFSLGLGHSPHYIYHSAFAQIREMELITAMYGLDPEKKKGIAKEILSRWQKSGRDSGADEYLRNLQEQESSNRVKRSS